MPGRVQSCGCCDVDGWLNGWMDGLPLKMFIFPWREALIFTPEGTKSIVLKMDGERGEGKKFCIFEKEMTKIGERGDGPKMGKRWPPGMYPMEK